MRCAEGDTGFSRWFVRLYTALLVQGIPYGPMARPYHALETSIEAMGLIMPHKPRILKAQVVPGWNRL